MFPGCIVSARRQNHTIHPEPDRLKHSPRVSLNKEQWAPLFCAVVPLSTGHSSLHSPTHRDSYWAAAAFCLLPDADKHTSGGLVGGEHRLGGKWAPDLWHRQIICNLMCLKTAGENVNGGGALNVGNGDEHQSWGGRTRKNTENQERRLPSWLKRLKTKDKLHWKKQDVSRLKGAALTATTTTGCWNRRDTLGIHLEGYESNAFPGRHVG